MDEQAIRTVDKSTWGDGPWQTEPDRVEWAHAGLPCLALRSETSGAWCGYTDVPPGHPLHGTDYGQVDVEVHGGLTYSGLCDGDICHVPKPGQPDDVWWLGSHCNHVGDFAPAYHARMRKHGLKIHPDVDYDHAAVLRFLKAHPERWDVMVYRTVDYVQAETNRLAEQLAALAVQPLLTLTVGPEQET